MKCRDLKPENVLFHESGHLRLSDFGIAFHVTAEDPFALSKTGTPGYMAPEVVKRRPYSYPADYFSLGILLYELAHGVRPQDPIGFKESLSKSCTDFILGLLHPDPAKRIGCILRDGSQSRVSLNDRKESGFADAANNGDLKLERSAALRYVDFDMASGCAEIKRHPFFRGINWEKLARLELQPPFVPDPTKANCSNSFALEDQMADDEYPNLSEEEQKKFESFNFNVDIGAMRVKKT